MIEHNPNQTLKSFVRKLLQKEKQPGESIEVLKSEDYYLLPNQLGTIDYPKSQASLMIYKLLEKIDIHFVDLVDDLVVVRQNHNYFYIFHQNKLVAASYPGES